MNKTVITLLSTLLLTTTPVANSADYVIDTKGAHASIQFRIKHLGYSWLTGRFNRFSGHFSYDKNAPEKSSVSVTIDTASVDSNHAERDKHLRDKDFLWVSKFPEARFVSTAFKPTGDGTASLEGKLTLHGVTKPITIAVEEIGHGLDPWGGYRQGFAGTTRIKLQDFDMIYELGAASREVELVLNIEGIRQ